MRIGDAATLQRDKVENRKLLLYTAKTNTPVHLPLPKEVTDALVARGETGELFSGQAGEE